MKAVRVWVMITLLLSDTQKIQHSVGLLVLKQVSSLVMLLHCYSWSVLSVMSAQNRRKSGSNEEKTKHNQLVLLIFLQCQLGRMSSYTKEIHSTPQPGLMTPV